MKDRRCQLCINKVNQNESGSGGIEIGFLKWFNSLQPWKVQIIICYDCFWKLSEYLNLSEWDKKTITEQKTIKLKKPLP